MIACEWATENIVRVESDSVRLYRARITLERFKVSVHARIKSKISACAYPH